MKTMIKVPLLFVLTLLTVTCKKESPASVYTNDYFPLSIGNKWEYRSYTKEVKKLKSVNNQEYYEIENNQYHADTIFYTNYEYLRKTADGKVYELNQDQTNEFLLYDFTVHVNQSWSYKEGAGEWKVTNINDQKVVTINGNAIENCIQYNYDIEQAVDDEHTVILAPGIGRIVSQSFAWGTGDTLRNALINGVKYDFK